VEKTACGNRFRNWLPIVEDVIYDHRYVYSEIGYNLRPLEMQGAIGLEQIKKLPMLHQARKDNFNQLLNIFKKYEKYFYLPRATERSDPSWFAFLLTVRLDAPFKRQDIIHHLESAKIQTRTYFAGNILFHPGYSTIADQYDNILEKFPNSNLVTSNSFFLGTFAGIDKAKIDYIGAVVDEFFQGLK
jgi:CDP-6-deoxy-D-xylo-4-hexulose-3-dehydrase